jgi:hypothetical protein
MTFERELVLEQATLSTKLPQLVSRYLGIMTRHASHHLEDQLGTDICRSSMCKA